MSVAVATSRPSQQQAGVRAAGTAAAPHGQQQVSTQSPFVEVTEQPKSHGLRFRYECEGRSAGSIPGESSTDSHRTYPTITIHNYPGPSAVVVVSLVTKDNPPKAHPHKLVGRDCKDGVCTMKLQGTYTTSFPNIGIQCVKKGAVKDSLEKRKQLRVDPYSTGFGHLENPSDIDMSIVRLCWQVFLPDAQGKFTRALKPLVSEFIYDKKTASDLVICRLSKNSGSVKGGEEVFLLCEKVHKEDIEVIIYEEQEDGTTLWSAKCDFGPTDVHKQHAIVLKTPPYHDFFIEKPVEVKIQLYRPSDRTNSDSKQFIYIPDDPDPDAIDTKRKRKKLDSLQSFYSDLASSGAAINGDLLIPATVEPSPTSEVKQRIVRKVARNKSKAPASTAAASSSSGVGSAAEVEMEEEVNTSSPTEGGPASAVYTDVLGGPSNLVAMAMGMSGANEIQLQDVDVFQLLADNQQQFQFDPTSGAYIYHGPLPPQFATVDTAAVTAATWQQQPGAATGGQSS